MPNFKIHQLTNYVILILIIISLFLWFRWNILVPIFIIGFIVGTNWLTPDLDVNSKPSNHKMWWLYKKISKHRGKTHSLIFGFMLPLLYVSIISLLLIGLLGYFMNDKYLVVRFIEEFIRFIKMYYIHFGSFIGGICVANGIHIIQDKL